MEDKRSENPTAAMQAAKQGRAVQMSRYEKYIRGESVDFKSHQGTSHVEVYDPNVYKKQKTVRLNFQDRYRFFDAVNSSDEDMVSNLLDSGLDVNTRNEDGLTALHQCCIENNLKMASALVMRGAEVNVQDCDGWTPLHAAAACGFWRLSNFLLSHGADPKVVNTDGELAIDVAENDKTKNIIREELVRQGYDSDAKLEELRQAPQAQLLARVTEMVNAGEDVNALDQYGYAPLHAAASNGWLDVMEYLLTHGANVNVRDGDGNTALHLAAFFEQYHAVELLGKFNVDVDAANRHRESASIVTEDPTMLRLLKALRSHQDSSALLASVKRVRVPSAAGRRHTAGKKDLTKADMLGEHKALETGHQEPSAAADGVKLQEESEEEEDEGNAAEEPSPAKPATNGAGPSSPSLSAPSSAASSPAKKAAPVAVAVAAQASSSPPKAGGSASKSAKESGKNGTKQGDGDAEDDEKRRSAVKQRKPTQAAIVVEAEKKKSCCVLM